MNKRSIIKILKQNGFIEWDCTKEFPPLNMEKVFYLAKHKFGNILTLQIDGDLSFHFGYNKTIKKYSSICFDGYQCEIYCWGRFWEIAEQCIIYGYGKEYVKKYFKK